MVTATPPSTPAPLSRAQRLEIEDEIRAIKLTSLEIVRRQQLYLSLARVDDDLGLGVKRADIAFSDPTGNAAKRMADDHEYQRMKAWRVAILDAFAAFDDRESGLLWQFYTSGLRPAQVYDQSGMSRTWFWEQRCRLIAHVAARLPAWLGPKSVE